MKSMAEIFRSHCVFVDGKHTNGTDKQSNHAYGDSYDAILDREAVKLMLEIGVADGSSLLAWHDAFPNATVVGMDIHPAAKWDGEFHIGDQQSYADCMRAAAGRQFDVIVEDATHQLGHTLLTLFHLWPSVKPGGMYIVEEWANIGATRDHVLSLWPNVEIVDTKGPFGGIEPLIVFRKPLC